VKGIVVVLLVLMLTALIAPNDTDGRSMTQLADQCWKICFDD
jgi:hypothetical protein